MIEWREIPGFGGLYSVSSEGQIRRRARLVERSIRGRLKERWISGGELKQGRRDGFRVVTLFSDGRKVTRLVHRLVLLAFSGPCPEGWWAAFLNGNRLDCRACNLRWDPSPPAQQPPDRRGERNANAKLTQDDVDQMRAARMRPSEASRRYRIGSATASRILAGKAWRTA